ncbi:MAG TPA: hypothetical protein VNG31_01845 [Candidatus Baltobacteraceae bacterium]|nr:hypothetical protein [Candidatus Baltobacteraceae bacterium]
MTPLDIAEECVLLSLLGALALSYIVHRVQLVYYGRHARRILSDLQTMEARLRALGDMPLPSSERTNTITLLERLEGRLTRASKRLISWRASPVERCIMGPHIEALLFQYERSGAMTTRLLALISRQTSTLAAERVRFPNGRQEQAGVSAGS